LVGPDTELNAKTYVDAIATVGGKMTH